MASLVEKYLKKIKKKSVGGSEYLFRGQSNSK